MRFIALRHIIRIDVPTLIISYTSNTYNIHESCSREMVKPII